MSTTNKPTRNVINLTAKSQLVKIDKSLFYDESGKERKVNANDVRTLLETLQASIKDIAGVSMADVTYTMLLLENRKQLRSMLHQISKDKVFVQYVEKLPVNHPKQKMQLVHIEGAMYVRCMVSVQELQNDELVEVKKEYIQKLNHKLPSKFAAGISGAKTARVQKFGKYYTITPAPAPLDITVTFDEETCLFALIPAGNTKLPFMENPVFNMKPSDVSGMEEIAEQMTQSPAADELRTTAAMQLLSQENPTREQLQSLLDDDKEHSPHLVEACKRMLLAMEMETETVTV